MHTGDPIFSVCFDRPRLLPWLRSSDFSQNPTSGPQKTHPPLGQFQLILPRLARLPLANGQILPNFMGSMNLRAVDILCSA